jgi:transcriptional regulator GlxA family with amidase domain
MNIGIYIYDEAEVLDFSGPFEVFTTASRVCKTITKLFEVFLISKTGAEVVARTGYKVIPNYGFHNHPNIDVLIISGGVYTQELKKTEVINWISTQSKLTKLTASVCTGAFLLAKAQVIKKNKVTTHWEDIEDLKKMFSELTIAKGGRWVDEGDLVTSGGISAGIDMSLHLISKLQSISLAEDTVKQIEFLWLKNS